MMKRVSRFVEVLWEANAEQFKLGTIGLLSAD